MDGVLIMFKFQIKEQSRLVFHSEDMHHSFSLKDIDIRKDKCFDQNLYEIYLANDLSNNSINFRCSLNNIIALRNYLNILIKD